MERHPKRVFATKEAEIVYTYTTKARKLSRKYETKEPEAAVPRVYPISFDETDEVRGFATIFASGIVSYTENPHVVEVPKRTLKILSKLHVPFIRRGILYGRK